jgi:hypothetical protein
MTMAGGTGAAQAPQPQAVIGEVGSVDAAGKRLTVKADKGDLVTVVLEEKTLYLRVPPGEKDLKKASKIAFTDVSVGDRVRARGALSEDQKTLTAISVIVMTKADLAQKQEHDRADWQRRGITGRITAVNADAKEFTVSVRTAEGMKQVVVENAEKADFRRYAPDSVRFMDAKPSTYAELHAGDQVRVLGEKSADGARMKPEAIVSGSFRTIAATILSLDVAANEIKITDLDTKKPLLVKINPDTSLKKLDPRAAMFLARRLNPQGADQVSAGAGPGQQRPPAGGPDGQRQGGPDGQRQGRPDAPFGAGAAMGGMRGGGGGDVNQMLEHTPSIQVSELKQGDAVIISSTTGVDPGRVTAITLLAGVEPILTSAPKAATQFGAWTFDMGMPQ